MRNLVVILFGALLLIGAASAMTATMPNSTAPGYPYEFSANMTAANTTPCIITATDATGYPAKVWTVNGDGFPMFTNRQGVINSYVRIDDSFAQGANYTFTLKCGSESASQAVAMGTGGSLGINILFLNRLDWINAHPNEAILGGVGVFIILVIAGIAISATRTRTIFKRK